MRRKAIAGSIIACFLWIIASCGDGGMNKSNPGTGTAINSKGAQVYGQFCVSCHGKNGALGLSGAANLQVSILTQGEVNEVVTNGRRLMAPFKDVLKADEIDAVSEYVLTLRR